MRYIYLRTLLIFAIPTLLLGCTNNKNKKVQAFCSELKGSHITMLGCHWNGRIRMDVGDSRSGQMKPMVTWVVNADSGNIDLYNLGRKTKNPNPLATQQEELKQNKNEMKLYLERKKQNDESIEKTEAVAGRSPGNNSFDKNCSWYQLKEPPNPMNKTGRWDDVCIEKYEIKMVEAYAAFVESIKKVDMRYHPIALDGLPILNWRLPFQSEKGWIEDGKLPKVFVTGSAQAQTDTAMDRMDFRYFFKETTVGEMEFKPDWAN